MKKAVQNTSKSLKTFYLYTILVFLVICVSLVVKGFYVIQQSRFDPTHHFTLVVTKQNKVKEILSFHPQTPSVSILKIKNSAIPFSTLAKEYGIVSDGYIQADSNTSLGTDTTSFLWSSIIHSATWQSNLTIIDKIRLLLLVKSMTTNNKVSQNVTLTTQSPELDTTIVNSLTDQDIATENVSIQIVNATNVSGFGKRLARVLTIMGANVIDITTAQKTQEKTTIAYYGNKTYTLSRVQHLLDVPVHKLSRQPIADIVITIGKDKKGNSVF